MNIEYLKNDQINRTLWDEKVTSSSNGQIYFYTWYLDIVSPGWEALVTNGYEQVMPLTRRKKFGIEYLFPPFFTQQLGILSQQPLTRDVQLSFQNSIPSKFKFIEINLNQGVTYVPDSFEIRKNLNYMLDLDRSYKQVREGYSENAERNVRKASRNGLSLFKNSEPEPVIQMFRSNRGKDVMVLMEEHYVMFRELVSEAKKRGIAHTWITCDPEGLPCAGAIFFECLGKGIFIFSATNQKGRNLSGMYFLIDNYILENAGRIKVLDFEGSNDPDLARFYRSFGSNEYVYLQIKRNKLSAPWKWFKH